MGVRVWGRGVVEGKRAKGERGGPCITARATQKQKVPKDEKHKKGVGPSPAPPPPPSEAQEERGAENGGCNAWRKETGE